MTVTQQIATSELYLSPHIKNRNASKVDPEKIRELADSIRENGQLAPGIARKASDPKAIAEYELLVGTRRWRACALLGIGFDVIVRELDDRQAQELVLVENVQREDLPPLDEAEAYAHLLELGHPDAKSIADRVGKKPSHVVRRLALLQLSPRVRAALEGETIGIEQALLIARVPSAKVQEELLDWAVPTNPNLEPSSARELREHIMRGHTRDLSTVPWDLADATLVASAGACETCPSNTAIQQDLYSDVEAGKALCTDAACFAKKVDRYVSIRAKEDGRTVLSKAEAAKVIDPFGNVRPSTGYIDLDANCYVAAPTSAAHGKPWRKALKKELPKDAIVLAAAADGTLRELLPERIAKAALRKAHPDEAKNAPDRKRKNGGAEDDAGEHEAAEARERLGYALLGKIVEAIAADPSGDYDEVYRVLAETAAFACPVGYMPPELERLFGTKSWEELSGKTSRSPAPVNLAIALAALMLPVLEEDGPESSRVVALCKAYGIKPKAVEKAIAKAADEARA